MANTKDTVRSLYNKVQKEKAKLAAAVKGSYVTDGNFRFGANTQVIDIKIVRNTDQLTDMMSFLLQKQDYHDQAQAALEIEPTTFKWFGATVEEWANDLSVRATTIDMVARKAKLQTLETKLLSMDADLLKEIELEAIAEALK